MTARRQTALWGAIVVLISSGCTDAVPTSEDPDLIPIRAETFEVWLPFSAFGQDFRVFGGFGAPSELNLGLVSLDRPEGFESRALLRFGAFPTTATVEDAEGETQVDSALAYRSGRVVLRMDTTSIQGEPPFTLTLEATESRWHAGSASWEMAIDTLGEQLPWEVPGGGSLRTVGQGVWDPAEADSVIVDVDSLAIAGWEDTEDESRGLRVSSETTGARVRINSAALQIDAEPSVNPDTTVTVGAGLREMTFIYHPTAEISGDAVRVGGAPAFRTVFQLDLPTTVDPPDHLCARINCPLTLTPDLVVFASLLLETRATDPAGLQPADTLLIEMRPVLDPDRLPRSPLGSAAQSRSVRMNPPLFGEESGQPLEVPITPHVRDMLESRAEGRTDFPKTVALLSAFEPTLPGVAMFARPGEDGEPQVRLLITVTEGIRLP